MSGLTVSMEPEVLGKREPPQTQPQFREVKSELSQMRARNRRLRFELCGNLRSQVSGRSAPLTAA